MRVQRIDEIRSMVKQAAGLANGNRPGFGQMLATEVSRGGPRIEIENDPIADLIVQARSRGDSSSATSILAARPESVSNGITRLPGVMPELSELLAEQDGPSGSDWIQSLPSKGQAWADEIQTASERYGLDPRLMASLVWSESGFDPAVTSHAGAIGLAQLMPGTAEGLGVDPWDPAQNLDGGARFLSSQIDRFGSVELALAAYNAGPSRVERAGGIPNISETQNYVRVVMDRYALLGGNR